MIKVLGLVERRPDLELDAFRLHWRTIHRGLALRLAHAGLLRGYVQNHRLAIEVDGLEPFADGVPELWFDDVDALNGMRDSPAFRDGAFHDGPRFMRVDDYQSLLLQPEADVAASSRRECAGLLKCMVILSENELGDLTGGGDSPVFGKAEMVRRSYQFAARETAAIAIRSCAAIETSWWADLPSFLHYWSRRRLAKVSGILVEERPVFWPGEVPPPADWSPVDLSARQS